VNFLGTLIDAIRCMGDGKPEGPETTPLEQQVGNLQFWSHSRISKKLVTRVVVYAFGVQSWSVLIVSIVCMVVLESP
jgi:hypothetical protein